MHLRPYIDRFIRALSSPTTLFVIIGLFAVQALWLALTSRYPMAFDENFHLGLMQIYSHHWLPFLSHQPSDATVYGAVARDPSYLYHYLMSFPYRLIQVFTDNLVAQVIVLRLINVALAVSSLFVYADILKRTPLSAAYRHAVLFILTVIPVMPLVAAQINYDNLLFLVVALVVRQTLLFVAALRQHRVESGLLAQILLLLMAGSLVKYPFVPIGLAVVVFIIVEILLQRGRGLALWSGIRRSAGSLSRPLQITYVIALLIVGGLFVQRYGINLIRHHDPVPDCAQVLTVDECMDYAPWGRDYQYAAWNQGEPRDNAVMYAPRWFRQLMKEFFFGVYSKFETGTNIVHYWGSLPVWSLLHLGWLTLALGTLTTIVYIRSLWRQAVFRLFLIIGVLYVGALFYQNYQMYLHTNVAVAIHGRYVLPVVPFILAVYVYGFRRGLGDLLRYVHRPNWLRPSQALLGVVVLLVCTQGGGFTTYILRGKDDFVWPDHSIVQRANGAMRRALDTIIIE